MHEISVRQQHLRSKEETEREYVKSDCADMHLSSDNTKINRSRLSGIQTYDICLFTGAPSVPKNAIFKT